MNNDDAQAPRVIATAKEVIGTVKATSKTTNETRILKEGSLIYSDDDIDISKGRLILEQDGNVVKMGEITTLFNTEELSDEEKKKLEKISDEIEQEEESKLKKDIEEGRVPIQSLESETLPNEETVDEYKVVRVNLDVNPVDSKAVNTDLKEPNLDGNFPPEIPFIQPGIVFPSVPPAPPFVFQSSLTNVNSDLPLSSQLTYLSDSQRAISVDVDSAFNLLNGAHPQTVFAVTFPDSTNGNGVDNAPIVAALPGVVDPVPTYRTLGPTAFPGTRTELYTYESLMEGARKTEALMEASEANQTLIMEYLPFLQDLSDSLQTMQITDLTAISELQDRQDEILTTQNELAQEVVIANMAMDDAQIALDAFLMGAINDPVFGNTTIGNAIENHEQAWLNQGGTPNTMPAELQSLYDLRAPLLEELHEEQTTQQVSQSSLDLSHEIFDVFFNVLNMDLSSDSLIIQGLEDAIAKVDQLYSSAQSQINTIQLAMNDGHMVIVPGVGVDKDFAFNYAIYSPADLPPLVPGINNVVPINVDALYSQSLLMSQDKMVLVDAVADGVATDLAGQLLPNSQVHAEVLTSPQLINVNLHVQVPFADPDLSENLTLEIPGLAGVNWSHDNASSSLWNLQNDGSLVRVIDKVARPQDIEGIDEMIQLSFDAKTLQTVDLNALDLLLRVHVVDNPSVMPGDQELDLANNETTQEFTFSGELPGRQIIIRENDFASPADFPNDQATLFTFTAPLDISGFLENLIAIEDLIVSTSHPPEQDFLLDNLFAQSSLTVTFANIASNEPPRIETQLGPDFSDTGNPMITRLEGDDLRTLADLWRNGTPQDRALLETPLLVPAQYGASDFQLEITGLINGVSNLTILPLIDVTVDARADGIINGAVEPVPDSFKGGLNVATFDLKVVAQVPDTDGSEAHTIRLDFTDFFSMSDIPDGMEVNWHVPDPSSPWSFVEEGGQLFLQSTIPSQGQDFESTVTVGLNSQILQYVTQAQSQLVVGGFVDTHEVVPPTDQDFDLSNDEILNQPLQPATIEVAFRTVFLKEKQVEASEATPGLDSYALNLEKALVKLQDDIQAISPTLLDSIGDSGSTVTFLDLEMSGIPAEQMVAALFNNREISFDIDDGTSVTSTTLFNAGNELFVRFQEWYQAVVAEDESAQLDLQTHHYCPEQYFSGVHKIQAFATDLTMMDTFLDNNEQLLEELTLIFDAVVSGLATDATLELTNPSQILDLGADQSEFLLTFKTAVNDLDFSEVAEVQIQLPNLVGMTTSAAPPDLTNDWTLVSGNGWSLEPGNILTRTFTDTDLIQGPTFDSIVSDLVVGFNTQILRFLTPQEEGGGIADFGITVVLNDTPVDEPMGQEFDFTDNQSTHTFTSSIDISSFIGLVIINEFEQMDLGGFDFDAANNGNQIYFESLIPTFEELSTRLSASGLTSTDFFASTDIIFTAAPKSPSDVSFDPDGPNMFYKDVNGNVVFLPQRTPEGGETAADVIGETSLTGIELQTLFESWQNSGDTFFPQIYVLPPALKSYDFLFDAQVTVSTTTGSETFTGIPQASVVVDATAQGVLTDPQVAPTFETTLDYTADPMGTANGIVVLTFDVQAQFFDPMGTETHTLTIDIQDLFDSVNLPNVEIEIVPAEGQAFSAWQFDVQGSMINPGVFKQTLLRYPQSDFQDTLVLHIKTTDLPAELLENFEENIKLYDQIFTIESIVDPDSFALMNSEPDEDDNTVVYQDTTNPEGIAKTVGVVEGPPEDGASLVQQDFLPLLQQNPTVENFSRFNEAFIDFIGQMAAQGLYALGTTSLGVTFSSDQPFSTFGPTDGGILILPTSTLGMTIEVGIVPVEVPPSSDQTEFQILLDDDTARDLIDWYNATPMPVLDNAPSTAFGFLAPSPVDVNALTGLTLDYQNPSMPLSQTYTDLPQITDAIDVLAQQDSYNRVPVDISAGLQELQDRFMDESGNFLPAGAIEGIPDNGLTAVANSVLEIRINGLEGTSVPVAEFQGSLSASSTVFNSVTGGDHDITYFITGQDLIDVIVSWVISKQLPSNPNGTLYLNPPNDNDHDFNISSVALIYNGTSDPEEFLSEGTTLAIVDAVAQGVDLSQEGTPLPEGGEVNALSFSTTTIPMTGQTLIDVTVNLDFFDFTGSESHTISIAIENVANAPGANDIFSLVDSGSLNWGIPGGGTLGNVIEVVIDANTQQNITDTFQISVDSNDFASFGAYQLSGTLTTQETPTDFEIEGYTNGGSPIFSGTNLLLQDLAAPGVLAQNAEEIFEYVGTAEIAKASLMDLGFTQSFPFTPFKGILDTLIENHTVDGIQSAILEPLTLTLNLANPPGAVMPAPKLVFPILESDPNSTLEIVGTVMGSTVEFTLSDVQLQFLVDGLGTQQAASNKDGILSYQVPLLLLDGIPIADLNTYDASMSMSGNDPNGINLVANSFDQPEDHDNVFNQIQTFDLSDAFAQLGGLSATDLANSEITITVGGGIQDGQRPTVLLAKGSMDSPFVINVAQSDENETVYELTGQALVDAFNASVMNPLDEEYQTIGVYGVRYNDADLAVSGNVSGSDGGSPFDQDFLLNTFVVVDAVVQGVDTTTDEGLQITTSLEYEKNQNNELTQMVLLTINLSGEAQDLFPDPSSETHTFNLRLAHSRDIMLTPEELQSTGTLFSLDNPGLSSWAQLPSEAANLDGLFQREITNPPTSGTFNDSFTVRIDIPTLQALGYFSDPALDSTTSLDALNFDILGNITSVDNQTDFESTLVNNDLVQDLNIPSNNQFSELKEAQTMMDYDAFNQLQGTPEQESIRVGIGEFLLELQARFGTTQPSKIQESALTVNFFGLNPGQVVVSNLDFNPGPMDFGGSMNPFFTENGDGTFVMTGDALLEFYNRFVFFQADDPSDDIMANVQALQDQADMIQMDIDNLNNVLIPAKQVDLDTACLDLDNLLINGSDGMPPGPGIEDEILAAQGVLDAANAVLSTEQTELANVVATIATLTGSIDIDTLTLATNVTQQGVALGTLEADLAAIMGSNALITAALDGLEMDIDTKLPQPGGMPDPDLATDIAEIVSAVNALNVLFAGQPTAMEVDTALQAILDAQGETDDAVNFSDLLSTATSGLQSIQGLMQDEADRVSDLLTAIDDWQLATDMTAVNAAQMGLDAINAEFMTVLGLVGMGGLSAMDVTTITDAIADVQTLIDDLDTGVSLMTITDAGTDLATAVALLLPAVGGAGTTEGMNITNGQTALDTFLTALGSAQGDFDAANLALSGVTSDFALVAPITTLNSMTFETTSQGNLTTANNRLGQIMSLLAAVALDVSNLQSVIEANILLYKDALLDEVTEQADVDAAVIAVDMAQDDLDILQDLLDAAQMAKDQLTMELNDLINQESNLQQDLLDITGPGGFIEQAQNGAGTDLFDLLNIHVAGAKYDNSNFTFSVTGEVASSSTESQLTQEIVQEQLVIVETDVDSVITGGSLLAPNTQIFYFGQDRLNEGQPVDPFPDPEMFDYNAAEQSRFKVQLNLQLQFEHQDPNDSHEVVLKLPYNVPGGSSSLRGFDWELVPGEESGWTIEKDPSEPFVILRQTFDGVPDGLVKSVVGISYLSEAEQRYTSAPLFGENPPSSPDINKTVNVQVEVKSTAQSVDFPELGTVEADPSGFQAVSNSIVSVNQISIPFAFRFNGVNFQDDVGDNILFFGTNRLSTVDLTVDAGVGTGFIIGNRGDDTFHNEEARIPDGVDQGDKTIVAGSGQDWIETGDGNDNLFSHGKAPSSNDLNSDSGVATIRVSTGFSDNPNVSFDTIFFGSRTDIISGGNGDDRFFTHNEEALLMNSTSVGTTGVTRSAGALVFTGEGDDWVFSGRGADAVILDSASSIGAARETGSSIVGRAENLLNFTSNDYITLYYGEPFTGMTLASFSDESRLETRLMDNGVDTLVYWLESVTQFESDADMIFYFGAGDTPSGEVDKINLTGIFEQLGIAEEDRDQAIQLDAVQLALPGELWNDNSTVGAGTRVSVIDPNNGDQYFVADLHGTNRQDVIDNFSNIFVTAEQPIE